MYTLSTLLQHIQPIDGCFGKSSIHDSRTYRRIIATSPLPPAMSPAPLHHHQCSNYSHIISLLLSRICIRHWPDGAPTNLSHRDRRTSVRIPDVHQLYPVRLRILPEDILSSHGPIRPRVSL
uniref:Uncharacterized protein n=1 Tax=Schistocephalus solidus TaxID=70667 RepID=A0A0X3P4L0_SCHSO